MSKSKLTQSVHAGSTGDTLHGGVVTPIYPSAAYDYESEVFYPRYYFGGSSDAQTCYLIERSLKTIVLRVRQQNKNAMALANFLQAEEKIGRVNYPGLKDHPGHRVAKKQMIGGFGGMLSFELKGNPDQFLRKLKLIRKAVSLGGVESTITFPVKTSHAKLTAAERKQVGISDKLLRLSVGIEEVEDLINDIKQAL